VIGAVKLDRLAPADVRHLLAELVRADVGNTTVRQAHGLLRNALGDAERLELVPRNVARSVRPPAPEKGKRRVLTPVEARGFLAAARDERLYALLVLAITTGLRRGEPLALRWQDVAFDVGVVRVERSLLRLDGRLVFGRPKSASSVRTVPLPPAALDVLRVHRSVIEAESAAEGWQDLDLVFPSRVGTPIEPTNVNRWFRELRDRAGLPWLRLHDLRHAFATFMLDQGADLRLIMETLGHSQISVTADLYTHILNPRQRAASEAVDTLILGDADA
jgi:integrase